MDFRYASPPPPPPSSSDPHQPPPPQHPIPPPPGAWNSGQFQYHSLPPPQWVPQPLHSDHHIPPPPPTHYAAGPPPPMTYSSNPYSLPPRPHMHPPPQPHYPPVNQEWSNTSWGYPGFDYSAHNKNEGDWAARAREWAASKTVTDEQHQNSQVPPANRPEEINYQDQYSQNVDLSYPEFQQHSLPPSNYQQYPSSFVPQPRPPANHLQEPSSFSSGYASDGHFSYTARDGNLRDPSHQETSPTSLSFHQQEVSSSYSSVAGKDAPRDMNGNFYQQSHTPFVVSQHQVQLPDRPISIEQQPQYAFNNSSAEPQTDLSNQPLDFGPRYGHDYGPYGQSGPPGMSFSSIPLDHPTGQQADPSVGVPSPASMHSAPLFGSISSFQPTMPSGNAFHNDTYGTSGFLDRPKKASVPNWLREEIIKKKAVIGSSTQEFSRQEIEFNKDEEVMDRSFGKGDKVDGKSIESTKSTEEEDDDVEDDVELARIAAVNVEIKRLLTEVLLKVTDELFDEIATKVLDEDDLKVEVERKAISSSDTISAVITPKSSAKVLIPAKTKGIDSPGDVLGLGNYASDDDDDDEEKEVQNSSIPSSNSSKPAVHLAENGSSQKKLLEEEREPHVVSPNEANSAICNDNSGVEKVKADNVDFSKLKQSVTVEDSLPRNGQDKKHTKVDDKSRVHDESHVKRVKKEDQNGSKEKIKDRDSEKQVSKAEIKDDKKEIDRDRRKSRDKEDGRKRERGKDDKNERSEYKSVADSSKHKRRHRSPSPGGRGRSSKDHHARGSSDSSSSDSRRRVRSRRRDSSPSPVRSRRQVSRSRSPPSKHSHRKHSNYSSLETTRERRRSRSRSRRG